MPHLWEVVGGADKGGIVVREGRELSSAARERLATGSAIEEIQLIDSRLHFRRLAGAGPDEGWVTTVLSGKVLVRRAEEAFAGTWEDDEGTEVIIEGSTMRGLGTSVPFEVSGVRMCCFRMDGDTFNGRLLSDGRILWSDGAMWQRKVQPGALVISEGEAAPKKRIPQDAVVAAKGKARPKEGLPPRGADGRRPLPGRTLSATEIIEWIADAVDVFETLLLPLEPISEAHARQQYKQLLLLVHPDKNRNPGATDAFRKLFDALAVIVDPALQNRALRAKGGTSKPGGDGPGFGFPGFAGFGFGFFDEYGGVGGLVAAVFSQENVDESERVLHEQCELLESMGRYDGSTKTWIDPQQAKELWDSDQVTFVDVRDADEYQTSRIEGALNLNWALASMASRLEEFKVIAAAPEKLVVVYSDNGSQLSRCGQVAESLTYSLRQHRVRRLRRGLNAWKRQGFPVHGSRQTYFARQQLGNNVAKLGDSVLELDEGQKSLSGS
ncbi:unnamed protein product [Effrenium voratum]|uniref:Rhodanese domain-containing protein n=1 Tax=Effrenium voratum TaxID=2562239 RepID=A0AA36JH95_9DINO|nr:unnamed protein product [Effrenium voratum]